jgi:hypothetical protein
MDTFAYDAADAQAARRSWKSKRLPSLARIGYKPAGSFDPGRARPWTLPITVSWSAPCRPAESAQPSAISEDAARPGTECGEPASARVPTGRDQRQPRSGPSRLATQAQNIQDVDERPLRHHHAAWRDSGQYSGGRTTLQHSNAAPARRLSARTQLPAAAQITQFWSGCHGQVPYSPNHTERRLFARPVSVSPPPSVT